ncbi:MAG TPA: DNA methyltransferase [Patescibacteria group bacterium]|jgi:tRNA G10  N-methylase Trm11|nr:DNA methyltransferase [Patescibacteria group bacterium]
MTKVSFAPVSKTSEYGPLISPARDKKTPIYNWHAFKHSYSKELVGKLVKKFDLRKNSWVLDPFCGGGTTLLACKELGINAKGFDILPFSVFLTNVKTKNYDPDELRRGLLKFNSDHVSILKNIDLPDIAIARKAFSVGVKNELLSIKQKINSLRNPVLRDFYMLGLLSILESVSNTVKAGGFLRIEKKYVQKEKVRSIFLSKIETMINDVENFNQGLKINKTKTSAEISDSRDLPMNRLYDAIITSPPYPNRHDYTRIYGLEMIFNFVKTNDDLKKIRYDTLRSHVEAKKRFQSNNYKKPVIIDKLISKVKRAGVNNSKVPEMIEGYFEDMFLSLSQMQKHLKKGGRIALVVSNVRFGGVNIPVDTILAKIGEQVGLSTEAVVLARHRGNSAQQMKQFKRKPSRESIVIWVNP